jgi:subtilisin family serine protease
MSETVSETLSQTFLASILAFSLCGGAVHSSSPLAPDISRLFAGVGALLLSANPNLTWAEVRDVLRETAVPIDAGNRDPFGIWRDDKGVAANAPGYTGPHYSRWYGFGRIDAAAAVKAAIARRQSI